MGLVIVLHLELTKKVTKESEAFLRIDLMNTEVVQQAEN